MARPSPDANVSEEGASSPVEAANERTTGAAEVVHGDVQVVVWSDRQFDGVIVRKSSREDSLEGSGHVVVAQDLTGAEAGDEKIGATPRRENSEYNQRDKESNRSEA